MYASKIHDYMSPHAANACMYTTYCVFLAMGLTAAWYFRKRGEFLAGNHTRSGIYLALNFIASSIGCGKLVTFPQVAAELGLHGLLTYSATAALPMFLFACLGPMIRRSCPNGFVLTEWVRQRYGTLAGLTLSACTILTLYLYSVAELAAIQTAIISLTGLDGLPPLLVEGLFVAVYTCCGGFFTSFFTDNIQALMFIVLLVIAVVSMGVNVDIDKSLISPSGLLKANTVSWRLLYTLSVAIITNDCFLAGFWMRTFAARSDRDLWVGTSIAAFILFITSAIMGVTGLFAVWAQLLDPSSPDFAADSENAFYYVLLAMPKWVQGFVLVCVCCMSTSTFDSGLNALVSTISNDIFRNRLRLVYMRIITFALIAPIIVVALRAPSVLNIWIISDLLSSAIVPVLFLGLSCHFYWLSGFEVICGLIGGILTVFIYGTIYYGNVSDGSGLLLVKSGLYVDDWGSFGAFVAAPTGCLIGALCGLLVRGIIFAIKRRRLFAIFDRDIEQWDAAFMRWIKPKHHPWYEGKPDFFKKVDWLLFIPETEANEQIPHDDVESSESETKNAIHRIRTSSFASLQPSREMSRERSQ